MVNPQLIDEIDYGRNAGEGIYEAIEEQSKKWPADLIVVGTEGRRGFQRLMIGSVAEGLVRISTKPVLLIRGT